MCNIVTIKNNIGDSLGVADIKRDIIEKIIEIAADCKLIDTIYLFGSALEKRCTKRSDIDLAIISNVTRSKLFKSKAYDDFTTKLYQISEDQDYDILQFNSQEALDNSKEFVARDILTKGRVIFRNV
ncbi:MAG: nucleotidyltransferase domain-containing protein [Butyrivibrio sp.]|nr:nucleotidyltransferase domain-containing protein [Butyrivibrio sp.]